MIHPSRWDQTRADLQAFLATRHGQVLAWLLVVAATCLFLILLVDRPAAQWFATFSPDLHELLKFFADFGSSTWWLVGSFVMAAGFFIAARLSLYLEDSLRFGALSRAAAFFFAAVAVSGILNTIPKMLFGRFRPKLLFDGDMYGFDFFHYRADMLSFPSGHASTVAAIVTALYILFPRHIAAYVILGLMAAGARAAVNAHYLSDIVAGAFVGVVVTLYVRDWFERKGVLLSEAARGRYVVRANAPRTGASAAPPGSTPSGVTDGQATPPPLQQRAGT